MEHSVLLHARLSQCKDLSDAHSVDSGFSMESGTLATHEVFENDLSPIVADKLYNELQRVKEDLKLKETEILRAHQLRENTDREIEELTASLFESAHSMVEEAKRGQANTERKLIVANDTIETLAFENTQLKKIVHDLKKILSKCRPSSAVPTTNNQVDNILWREFASWEKQPSLERDSSLFMHRVYSEDVLPCSTFPNTGLSAKILAAIERNDIVMEMCHSKGTMKVCALTGELCPCDYRVRLGEDNQWWSLSSLARNRIVAICDFFTFIRHIKQGLVKSDAQSRYDKIIDLRKKMSFARLGL